MVAVVDNNLIPWSIQLKCLMDFGGPVAFFSQELEVVAPDLEDIEARVLVENLPFLPKVAI